MSGKGTGEIAEVFRFPGRTRQTSANDESDRIGVCDDPSAKPSDEAFADGEKRVTSDVQITGAGKPELATDSALREVKRSRIAGLKN